MYVASGSSIYEYNGNEGISTWDQVTITGNNGNIFQLASTSSHIYALCDEAGKRSVKSAENFKTFGESILPDHNVQSIYAQENQLFVGAGEIGSFYVLYHDTENNNFPKLIDTGNSMINGIAYDGTNYYLSAKDLTTLNGGCIYVINLDGGGASAIGNDIPFMGMISLDTAVFAIDRNGNLYSVPDLTKVASFGSKLATGTLAVWRNNNEPRLLIAGRQDEMKNAVNYEYGYLELEINSLEIRGTTFNEPGPENSNSISSINNSELYKSTIGKHPVNHIFQANDGTLFASTQKNGLWSYRKRDGVDQWNAEQ
jgi:hypothetical protein